MITIVFMAITTVSIAIFDIWVIFKKGKNQSISAYIIRYSKTYPAIPFLFGFLAGHLFWSMNTVDWQLP